MPPERLNPNRQFQIRGEISPLGIANFPEENGISKKKVEYIQEHMLDARGLPHLDRAGQPIPEVDSDNMPVLTRRERPKTQAEIVEEATTKALGFLALQEHTPVDLEPGEREYSALRDEAKIVEIAQDQRNAQHAGERKALIDQLSSFDPFTRSLADAALHKGLDPEKLPQWKVMNRKLQDLKRKSTPSTKLARDIALLERDIHLLETNGEKEVAQALRKVGLGGVVNRRAKKQKRQNRQGNLGRNKNEEELAIATLGEGRDKWDLMRRDIAEGEQLRNIVSAKGTTIIWGTKRYIVEDVHPQPAKAFVMKPILDPANRGKIKGYEPELDPSTGKPILKTIYVAIKVPVSPAHPDGKKLIPVPRDDRYQSGLPRRIPEDAEYCYDDGRRIRTEAIGEDSFSYIDDLVEVRPHYTAAEAVDAMVHGGIDTRHLMIRVGELEDYARRNPSLVRHHTEDIEGHFVLKDSEYPAGTRGAGKIKPEAPPLTPVYDLNQTDTNGRPKTASGHFERYTHSIDPNTGRPSKRTQAQIAREEFWAEVVAKGRMQKAYAKATDERAKGILGI